MCSPCLRDITGIGSLGNGHSQARRRSGLGTEGWGPVFLPSFHRFRIPRDNLLKLDKLPLEQLKVGFIRALKNLQACTLSPESEPFCVQNPKALTLNPSQRRLCPQIQKTQSKHYIRNPETFLTPPKILHPGLSSSSTR